MKNYLASQRKFVFSFWDFKGSQMGNSLTGAENTPKWPNMVYVGITRKTVKWYYTCQGLWDQNWSHLVSFGLTKTQNYLKLGSHWAHLRSHWSQSVWAQCEHSLWAHLRSHWAHLRSHCAHTGLMSPVFKSETSFRNFKSWAQCERILTPTGLIWAHKLIF